MSGLIDLNDQRFRRLVVVERGGSEVGQLPTGQFGRRGQSY
jgi:hypothetical protein